MRFKLNKLKQAFLAILLLEIFLGGSGRMIEIGSLTVRMYFFIIGLTISLVILFYQRKISQNVIVIALIALISILFSSVIGWVNNASLELIALDIKPLLFILFIISASAFVSSFDDVVFVGKLLKFSAATLSVLYLGTLCLLYFGYINFQYFWHATYDYHEFFFRGEKGFFTYKGFIYMGVGFIFWERLTPRGTRKAVYLFIISLAIILTGTRGFLLSLGIIYFFYLVVPKVLRGKIFYLIGLVIFGLFAIYFIGNTNLGDKAVSDLIRFKQLQDVIYSIDLMSAFIGHGFGVGVPSRPIHMEVAYLEIFHKQGLIGVCLWAILISYIVVQYFNIKKKKKYAEPFILSTFFVLILSFTNPYINNPIGLTVIILTVIAFNVINKCEANEDICMSSDL